MTRKQLVDALTANFKEDEEVTFVYTDDLSEVRETRVVIKDHTETHCNGHYELWELATDKWVKVTPKEYSETMSGMINKDRFQTQICGFLDPKWVADGPDIKDTKKVVYIGY